jgi:hypothetical protein
MFEVRYFYQAVEASKQPPASKTKRTLDPSQTKANLHYTQWDKRAGAAHIQSKPETNQWFLVPEQNKTGKSK